MVFKYPNKPIQAQLNNEVGDTALMALCIYKFLFPTEYYSIRRNCKSQLLSYLFATKLREIYENFENPMHIDSQPISDNRKNVLLNYMTIDVIPYLFQNSFTKDVFDIFSFLEDMFLDNHAPAIQEIPHINDYEKIFSRMEEYEKDCLLLYAAYFLELFQKFSYLEELKEELKHEVENIVQTLETKWHSDGDAENILQYAHQMLDNIT